MFRIWGEDRGDAVSLKQKKDKRNRFRQNGAAGMRENYRIFLDSKAGLISGTLRLACHEGTASGEMELANVPLALSQVEFEGNKRSFCGTLSMEGMSLDFQAEGELDDDVLYVMVRSGGRQMLITGFLQES